jgi:hypothetical protein
MLPPIAENSLSRFAHSMAARSGERFPPGIAFALPGARFVLLLLDARIDRFAFFDGLQAW